MLSSPKSYIKHLAKFDRLQHLRILWLKGGINHHQKKFEWIDPDVWKAVLDIEEDDKLPDEKWERFLDHAKVMRTTLQALPNMKSTKIELLLMDSPPELR